MIRFRRFLPLAVILATVAATFSAPSKADAAFELRYSTNGGTSFTQVFDNPTIVNVTDLNPAPNAILAFISGFTITASTGGSTSPSAANLELSVNSTAPLGPIDLIVQASFTGVNTAPAPQYLTYAFTGSIGSITLSAAGTQTFETFIDDNNALFGGATTIPVAPALALGADTGPKTLPTTSPQTLVFNASDPYSITTQIHVNITSGLVSISNDSNNTVTPTPAPASLALAFAGIPMFGAATWLRRRRNPASA